MTALDPETLVYSPNEASDAYCDYARKREKYPGITWGVTSIDEKTIPMLPGDLVGIMGRPGHGKSSLMAYLARKTAKDLVKRNAEDECVIYVTQEQIVEEIEAFFQISDSYNLNEFAFGKVPLDTVLAGAVKRISQPIWLIGKSMARRRQSPRMTIQNIQKAILSIEDSFGIKPAMVALDYIQIVPVHGFYKRWEQVEEVSIRCKEMAAHMGCPFVIGIQASRMVDDRQSKVPQMSDAQHSSGIEQTVDKLFGLWRPALTEERANNRGEPNQVRVGNRDFEVVDNLIVVKMIKQRMAQAGFAWGLRFAPQYVQLAEMEDTATARWLDYEETMEP